MNIYLSTTPDLSIERTIILRVVESLRASSTRLVLVDPEKRTTRAQALQLARACDLFIGLYARAPEQNITPEMLAAIEAEFEIAQEFRKPMLILARTLPEGELPDPRRVDFIERLIADDVNITDFESPAQLDDLVAQTLMTLIRERFKLQVTRPPFQAPRTPDWFVGREVDIARVASLLEPGRVIVLHSVTPIGGQGKTALAIQVAHRVREAFDGVLWANIPTARPAETLQGWARFFGGFAALGRGDFRFVFRPLPPETLILEDTVTRAEAFRDLVQGKRVLAILDGVENSADNAKLAPLLHALADCAVLVTSRTIELDSLNKAIPISLGGLKENEAGQLFTHVAGESRLNDARSIYAYQPEDQRVVIGEFAKLVDGLPLALELLAVALRENPDLTLEMLLRVIRYEHAQMQAQGDPAARSLDLVLKLRHMMLTPNDRQFFSTLAAFAGDDFDVDAVVGVTFVHRDLAAETLERLARLALVQRGRAPGRYRLHSVLKNFAREQIKDASVDERMARYYCEVAVENGRKLQANRNPAAMATLDLDLANIFAGQAYARARNDDVGWQLTRDFVSGAMTYYFSLKAMWGDWIAWSVAGIEASQKLGDEGSVGKIAGGLAMVYYRKNELDQAIEFCKYAISVMEKMGHQHGLATVYMNLGCIQTEKAAWKDAVTSLYTSLTLRERIGDFHGQAQARANIGVLYAKHGDKDKARANWMQALEMFEHLDKQAEADIVRKWLKGMPIKRF